LRDRVHGKGTASVHATFLGAFVSAPRRSHARAGDQGRDVMKLITRTECRIQQSVAIRGREA